MQLIQSLCLLIIFSVATICAQTTRTTTTTTTTTTRTTTTTTTPPTTTTPAPPPTTTTPAPPPTTTPMTVPSSPDPLAPSRLESIKNSISQTSRLTKLTPADFIFDFSKATTGVSIGTGGRTVGASASNFPGAIGHGIAMTIGYLAPCGINLPHTHPGATEINFSVNGDFQVGFLLGNSGSFILNDVHANQAAVFPQGSIHFEQNLNCVPATFVAAFNSEDPGVLTIGNAFFGSLPATIVGASLGGLNITTIEDIRLRLERNPTIGIEECKKRCGL